MKGLLLVVLLAACASSSSTTASDVAGGPGPVGPLSITVITAADNKTVVPGAEAYVTVLGNEPRLIAKSNAFGELEIKATDLQTQWSTLLVCHPLFYCGAFRHSDLEGFQSKTIALAPLILR
jgi:hypothetical protein